MVALDTRAVTLDKFLAQPGEKSLLRFSTAGSVDDGKSTLIGRLLLYNALDMSFELVSLKKNPKCKACGPNPEVTALIDYDAFCGVPGINHDILSPGSEFEINVEELASRLAGRAPLCLVDVREPHELQVSAIPGARNIPLGELAERLHELDSSQETVLMCKSGTRSRHALELFLNAGFRKVKNLKGGINAWARDIDPSLPIY